MVIEELRAELKRYLGINPASIVPAYRVIEEKDCDGYTRNWYIKDIRVVIA